MKHSPFQTKKKTITPVEVIEAGDFSIHLMKRGFIVPIEDYETDAVEKRQTEATAIFLEALKNCADKEGISSSEAQEKFYPTKTADGAEVEGADIRDYLDAKQLLHMTGLQSISKEDVRHVVTVMIRERLAYPVVVKSIAKAKSNLLPEIEPLRFQLAAGNKLLFGETIVEVDESATYEEETITVKPLTRQIEAGEVGYLLDITGQIKFGNSEWSLEHTKALIDDNVQGAAIYAFYKRELAQNNPPGQEDAGAENLTTSSIDSGNTSTENLSTGKRSIGASKATESVTPDSTPKTLAASQPG